MENSINPILVFASKGIIWKVLYDDSNEYLLVETRQKEAERAFYTSLSLRERKIEWENVSYGFSQKTLLTDLQGTKAILVNFEDGFLPKSKGIIVMDVISSKICWEDETLCFIRANKKYVWAYLCYDVQKKLLMFDIETGKLLEKSTEEIEKHLKEDDELLKKNINSMIEMPSYYKEGSKPFKTVEAFLEKNFQIKPLKKINYWEKDEFFAIEYEFLKENKLMLEFGIFASRDGKCLYKQSFEYMESSKTRDSSFWIIDRYLLYMPSKQEVLIFELFSRHKK